MARRAAASPSPRTAWPWSACSSDTPDHELVRPTMRRGRCAPPTGRCVAVAPVVETWAAAVGAARPSLLASPRSFCAGVERAIDVVDRALERYGPPVYVRRQIIHNTHVVADLDGGRRGVRRTSSTRCRAGAVVVLAAHGVAPAVRERGRGAATCTSSTPPARSSPRCTPRRGAAPRRRLLDRAHRPRRPRGGRRAPSGEAPEHIQRDRRASTRSTRSRCRDPDRVAYLTQTTLAVDETAAVVDAPARALPRRSSARAPTTSATPRRTARRRCAPSPPSATWCSSSARPTRRTPTAWSRSPAARASPPTSSRTRREIDLAWLAGARTRRHHRRRLGPRASRPPGGRPPRLPRCRSPSSSTHGHRRGRPVHPSRGGALMPIPLRQNMRVGQLPDATEARQARASSR